MTEPRISEQDLHDYVDDRLDDAGRARVAAYLARDAQARAKVEAWQAVNAGLRQLYGDAMTEPIPEKMLRLLRGAKGG